MSLDHPTSDLVSRLRCALIGCNCSEEYPGCTRCQAPLYSDDFIERGKLHWLYLWRDRWWRLKHGTKRRIRRKKCEVCGCKYWFGYPGAGGNDLCSEECFNDWLPF